MQWIDATECLTSMWVWEEEPISIWPVQRAKGQCGDFKPKVYHHAGTTSLLSQQSTTGIPTCHLPSVEPTCPKCGKGQHTLEHWLIECPALTVSYPATSLCVHRCISEPALSRTSQVHHAGKKVSLRLPWHVCQHTATTATESIRRNEGNGKRRGQRPRKGKRMEKSSSSPLTFGVPKPQMSMGLIAYANWVSVLIVFGLLAGDVKTTRLILTKFTGKVSTWATEETEILVIIQVMLHYD